MKTIGVVRTLGERTTEYSKYLISKQVSEVAVIENVTPIKEMMIKSFEIGIESGAEYLFVNDADVFILPNVVRFMINNMIALGTPTLTSYTKSKFFGKREGGIRIYDCKRLKDILSFVKDNDLPTRPEAKIWSHFSGKLIRGLNSFHEYEQDYRDIYKRFVMQSIRSRKPSHIEIINSFKKSNDMDLIVAYKGYYDKEKDFDKSFPDLKPKEPFTIDYARNKYLK